MAFPSSPINGQITVVNNVTYTYESAVTAWTRTAPTSANTITTDTANVTSNTTSISTTTGALRVAGGVGIAGNLNIGGTTYVTGDLLPTANNTVNLGSASQRFGTLYLAANTIDLGGTTITTAPGGELVFATQAGNVSLGANTINFLSTVANTSNEQGDLGVTGNLTVDKIYANSYFYSNGSVISTGGGGTTGGYLNMVMTGAVIPPVVGVARLYPPVNMTVTTVYANLSSAPSNGNMTFIIKKNGTSIGTTFTLSTALMTPVTVNVALTTADYLTIDVAGSSAADLHVTLKYV